MTTSEHLAHLLWLMAEYPEGWKAHCWAKAKQLAADPEHAELPRMLAEAMRTQPAKATAITGRESP